MLRMKENF